MTMSAQNPAQSENHTACLKETDVGMCHQEPPGLTNKQGQVCGRGLQIPGGKLRLANKHTLGFY